MGHASHKNLHHNPSSVTTVWKKIAAAGFRFYCVGCNRERRLSPPPKPGSTKFMVQILITTAFFTLLTYPWLNFKGLGFFIIPVGLVFEAFYRMKMRGALVCPDCSFDPILYLVDRDKAVRQVEAAWRKKFEENGIPFPDKKSARHQIVRAPASVVTPPTEEKITPPVAS